MAEFLQDRLPSLPKEIQSVRSDNNSGFDLDDIFRDAESQPFADFMLHENVSPCDRRPSMELQRHTAEARDDHDVRHHRAAETRKRTRNESIAFLEQQRRKRMRHLFSKLRSLLPIPASTKMAKYRLVEEAGKYIRSLQIEIREAEATAKQLEAKKELMDGTATLNDHPIHVHRDGLSGDNNPKAFKGINYLKAETRQSLTDSTGSDHNVSVDVYGTEVIVTITSFRMPRQLWRIYQELEANELDIQRADVYRGDSIVFLYFHANCSVHTSMALQSNYSLQNNLQSLY